MSSALDLDHIGPSSLDVGFGEVLHALLASLWRRRLLVGTIVAAALALGIIALLVITPSYTPEASIRGGFVASNAVAKDEDSKGAPSVSLDLMRVIETQSRLLQSQDLARRVVQQLGLERLQPELIESHWLPNPFHGSAADPKPDETDLAAAKLLRGLSVASDPLRTYLIKVRYTGTDLRACSRHNKCVRGGISAQLQAANAVRAAFRGSSGALKAARHIWGQAPKCHKGEDAAGGRG